MGAVSLTGFTSVSIATERPILDGLWLAAGHFTVTAIFVAIVRGLGVKEKTLIITAATLVAIGLLVQYRISPDLAQAQLAWYMIALFVAAVVVYFIKDPGMLERYKYILGIVGLVLLLSPIPFGVVRGGARLWIDFGPISFQPAELAKIMLAVFFAAYLADRYRQLSSGSDRLMRLPRLADIGPLIAMWFISLLVLVLERDLGSSLIFFSLFLVLLYVATGRWLYPVIGMGLFTAGAWASYYLFDHVSLRINVWLDPWTDFFGTGYQVAQAQLAFATGGIAGRGLGQGSPELIPAAATDFPLAVIGEELGLIGVGLVILLILLLVGRGFSIALNTQDLFTKLLATGLSSAIGLQALVIIGGVTKAIPMTGVTLPFVSYGGSSLLTNSLILALLLRIRPNGDES